MKMVWWWCPGSPQGLQWTDLPFDMQLAVLADIPLAELARLATLSKGMRAAYAERLKERQSCIQERLLAEGWLAEVPGELSPADMAVPRDLFVSPPIPERLQCTPHINQSVQPTCDEASLGEYRGFCLEGKPDGGGEWRLMSCSHVGSWRQGQRHGHGKTTTPSATLWREWREGQCHGTTIVIFGRKPEFMYAGTSDDGKEHYGMKMESNGNIWSGLFSRGTRKLEGHGFRRSASGEQFSGQWQQGKLNGWGKHTKPSGDTFMGEWVDHKYHGWGVYTCAATGARVRGFWRHGALVSQPT